MAEPEEKSPIFADLKSRYGAWMREAMGPFVTLIENRDRVRMAAQNNLALGISQLQKGGFKDAVVRFKLSLFFDKENAQTHALLGKAFLGLGKNEKARQSASKALEINPADADAAEVMAALAESTES